MTTWLRRAARDDQGQELLEFALASVVFLITVFGTLQFGIGIWRYNMVSDLAQEGARWASVRGVLSPAPASTLDVQNFVQSRAPGFTVTVTTTPTPSTRSPGDTITVQVETSFPPLMSLLPNTSVTLQGTASMIVSR